MEMPDGCFLIGYVDDVAGIITARDVEAAHLRPGQVMCRVRHWMLDHGLELAMAKTVIVLFTVLCTGGRCHASHKGGF